MQYLVLVLTKLIQLSTFHSLCCVSKSGGNDQSFLGTMVVLNDLANQFLYVTVIKYSIELVVN